MNALLQPLLELKSFKQVCKYVDANKNGVMASGVSDSQKNHLVFGVNNHLNKQSIIVTHSELKAKQVFEDLSFFYKSQVMLYPSKDLIFYSADVHSMDIVEARIKVLKEILYGTPKVIILSIEALLDRLCPKEVFKTFIIKKKIGDIIDTKEFCSKLISMGYERVDLVESKGQFAVRGGIIDIFPVTLPYAYRIELWDDEIDSIRAMETENQRSIENLQEFEVFPAIELVVQNHLFDEAIQRIQREAKDIISKFTQTNEPSYAERLKDIEETLVTQIKEERNFKGLESYISFFYKDKVTLLDYISKDTLIYLDEPTRIMQKCESTFFEFQESIKGRLEKGYLLKSQMDMIFSTDEVVSKINRFPKIILSTLMHQGHPFKIDETIDFTVKSMNPFHQQMDVMETELKHYTKNNYRVLLLAGTRTRAERLVKELSERGIRAAFSKSLINPIATGEVIVTSGSIHKGFEYPEVKFVVISEAEVFGQKERKKRKKKPKKGHQISSFAELKLGDYVVHENHGVGIYRGIEQIEVEGIAKDYLKISYKDDGNLYVPASQLDMLQKYIGAEGIKPKLNKLGGAEWQKTKARVKKSVADLADDLVELYAQRENKKGFIYGEDTVWQNEFEEAFPYEETDDQLSAIEDTKKDMESGKIMDRLVCGDVGYGKTEVAIRAAFKAVQDNKQVAFLVPTTILAQQHFNNFLSRMKDYPVNIELLSRFRTPKQVKTALENLKKGQVDIVIGTHRVLSKDVKFKNLGLLIVDEEQRFGVTHKEKIKQMKDDVDVLTLTATPIPRTLHMSLIGIRDMSVLEEPPQERYPVQTYVMEEDEELIKNAIYRELSRGGQVFYVYNRVKNIDLVTNNLKKLVPEATIAYAHGQMSERQLEEIMFEYINGEIDILVSTTIIETGLDIANANTMIIQNADHMGLSQLYQLRGRVGRSNRIAYAYLLYKKDKVLQQSAEKRLQAIKEFTEFGSGFKIAMRDLEIRGAGNLLGAQQHGHMEAVGYDMYCKLLEQAVAKVKNLPIQEQFETTININIDAFIPNSYIGNELQKLDIYKKIASIDEQQAYFDVQEELEDRFGDIPKSVLNLLEISIIKAEANQAQIKNIDKKAEKFIFEFIENAKVDPIKVNELVKKYRNNIAISSDKTAKIMFKAPKSNTKGQLEYIKIILQDLNELKLPNI